MHQNALYDPQIPPNAKHKFGITCPGTLFVESGPTQARKIVHPRFMPGCTGMHHVTCTSLRMQKHKFGITYLGVLLSNPYRS
jgi:hypothetical protein